MTTAREKDRRCGAIHSIFDWYALIFAWCHKNRLYYFVKIYESRVCHFFLPINTLFICVLAKSVNLFTWIVSRYLFYAFKCWCELRKKEENLFPDGTKLKVSRTILNKKKTLHWTAFDVSFWKLYIAFDLVYRFFEFAFIWAFDSSGFSTFRCRTSLRQKSNERLLFLA